MHIPSGLMDISINCIRAFNDNEILIATDGAGVYKMNTDTYASEPYIVADYNRYNSMNGNTINDIYIDSEQRIWMANYPIGITVRNNRYTDYQWIKHSIGNKQSLINDQVNAIIEDHDGDLWFATNTESASITARRNNGILFSAPSTPKAIAKITPSSHYARWSPASSGPEGIVPASTR